MLKGTTGAYFCIEKTTSCPLHAQQNPTPEKKDSDPPADDASPRELVAPLESIRTRPRIEILFCRSNAPGPAFPNGNMISPPAHAGASRAQRGRSREPLFQKKELAGHFFSYSKPLPNGHTDDMTNSNFTFQGVGVGRRSGGAGFQCIIPNSHGWPTASYFFVTRIQFYGKTKKK